MITVTPCAKVNLGLNITERRADGYHNLETVFCPVPIFDTLTIRENGGRPGTCRVKTEGITIEGRPEDNLVAKAYMAMCAKTALPGVDIELKKNIPTQAGMGGGSADCAYTLKALDMMFGMGMEDAELERMAAGLGADCAFFIKSEPCFAEGIGDVMSGVDLRLDGCWMTVVKPPVSVSTKEAFAGIRPHRPGTCCRDIVEKRPVEEWKEFLANDFERTIFRLHPELRIIKEQLYMNGADYAAMSGSGSALFGIYTKRPRRLALKGCRVETLRLDGAMERIPIVDEDGNTTGVTTRAYAHGGEKPLHPVVHLHVFSEDGRLYLQKRPLWKDIQPGKWDTAVGGHVDYGETVEQALRREAMEELGMADYEPRSLGRYVFESEAERELVNVFSTTTATPPHPSDSELDGGRFFTREEIAANIGKEVFTPNFEKEWVKMFGNGGK